jgi:uncharacterized membrane protein
MNTWTRKFKSIYRKAPVVSFLVTGGVVNIAIGSLSEHWSLMSVGLSVVGVAIALRVRQMQTRRPSATQTRPPVYALPPAAAGGLPMLSMAKKNPPG